MMPLRLYHSLPADNVAIKLLSDGDSPEEKIFLADIDAPAAHSDTS